MSYQFYDLLRHSKYPKATQNIQRSFVRCDARLALRCERGPWGRASVPVLTTAQVLGISGCYNGQTWYEKRASSVANFVPGFYARKTRKSQKRLAQAGTQKIEDSVAKTQKEPDARLAPSPSPYFVPGLPHGMLIELRQALISYQDYHMVCLPS